MNAYIEYQVFIGLNFIPLQLSLENQSLVLIREGSSPFLRLCISPYAFASTLKMLNTQNDPLSEEIEIKSNI